MLALLGGATIVVVNRLRVKGVHVFMCSLTFISVKVKIKLEVQVKVNFTLEEATKTQRGSRGIALLFL